MVAWAADGRLHLDEMRLTDAELREVDKIVVVACGTAYHAGLVAKYAIEHWTRIPVDVELASEFRYRDPIVDGRTLTIAISQSGETMDTLMALRYAREQGSKALAICNTVGRRFPANAMPSSTPTRARDRGASTKAFLTQIIAAYLVGLYLAQVRGNMFGDEIRGVLTDLADMPQAVDLVLDTSEGVQALARELVDATSVLFIGRHVGYPVALEGALKLKELAYMHAEGFAAGELKHGPIALIEEGVPVVCIVPSPRGRATLHDKIISNIQEVRARGARTIVIAEEGDESVTPYADVIFRVPAVPTLMQPLVSTVPLQVFACAMATVKGHGRRSAPQPCQVRHRRVVADVGMRAVYDVSQVRAAEQALMSGLPEGALMERAATGLADTCATLLRDLGMPIAGARAALLVGSGNNGGDALYAGARLAARGMRVSAVILGDRCHAGGLEALLAAGGTVSASDKDVTSADLVLDGVVGIGGKGALRAEAARSLACG